MNFPKPVRDRFAAQCLKLAAFFLALVFVCTGVVAQSGERFEQRFDPNHTYSITFLSANTSTMDAEGDEAMKAALERSSSIWGETTKDSTLSMFRIVTDQATDEGMIPFELSVDSMQVTQSEPYDLSGVKVYGKTSPSGAPEIDSVSGLTEDRLYKQALSAIVGSSFGMVDFPSHPLVVGDTFTDREFFPLQAGGVQLNVGVTSTYTLKESTDEKATFDIQRFYDMQGAEETASLLSYAHGFGTGQLIYDDEQRFITRQSSVGHIEIKLETQGLSVTIIRETSTLQKVEIESNTKP